MYRSRVTIQAGAFALLALLLVAAPAAAATDRQAEGQQTPGPPHAVHQTSGPYTAVPANVPPSISYHTPAISTLEGIWLGELTTDSNLRTGPGLDYPVNRIWPEGRRVLVFASATAVNGEQWYQVQHYPDPVLYIYAGLVQRIAALELPTAPPSGKWIGVDLSQQTVIAFADGSPVLLAQASTGISGHETPLGAWQIYWRLPLQSMAGGGLAEGDSYYNLKDIPYVQYFQQQGDALHGTFWHDNFGTPMSHGCVNLSYQNAEWLYRWAGLGTTVDVHE